MFVWRAATKRMTSAEDIVRLLMFDSVEFPQKMKSITQSLFVRKAHAGEESEYKKGN